MKFILLNLTFCLCMVYGFAQQKTGGKTIAENEQPDPDQEDEADKPVPFALFDDASGLFTSRVVSHFAAFHYRVRGYEGDQLAVYRNGLLMNDPVTGRVYWRQLGGLNGIFQDQYKVSGPGISNHGFGGLAGSYEMNTTAAAQHRQSLFSYQRSNRTYRNQILAAYSTGLMNNGWAVSVAAVVRQANEGYVPATFYNGYNGYLALSKKLSLKSMLHFTGLGGYIEQGGSRATTLEAISLAGSPYYNPDWGYLSGKKRNAHISSFSHPAFMLNYVLKPNTLTRLNIAASYQFGYDGHSALDWYNAQNPHPDYYRNLPSYYLYNPSGADPAAAEAVREEWLEHPEKAQINWDRLYSVNRSNFETINGEHGRRSLYVLGEDRNDVNQYNFAADLQKGLGNHVTVYTGIRFARQRSERYRKMLDLLGGDYYVNLNQFAERTYVGNPAFKQNDLNHPNEIIKEGDHYSYDYIIDLLSASWWGQARFVYHKINFFAAARSGLTRFSREGLYKNGIFQDDSYGKSAVQHFFTYGLKGGMTYQITGQHSLFINGAYETASPLFENTFYAPRVRNAIVDHPVPEKIRAIEAGYLLHTPNVNGRLAIFTTDIQDAARILRFYHEAYQSFVNYAMQGIAIRHLGTELSFKIKITPSFSMTALAAWMQVFYTSRPAIAIYRDNDTTKRIDRDTVFWKDYFATAGPQSVYTLGADYHNKKHWHVRMNFNYLNRAYVTVNPARLTREAVDLIEPGSAQWHAILDQEKLPAAFTVDLFAGKTFYLNRLMKWVPDRAAFQIGLGIRNVLNDQDILNSGSQQLRFDYETPNPARFPAKYTYAYGINYLLKVSFKF